jgi:succinoglycan biosynthesis protein ExoO
MANDNIKATVVIPVFDSAATLRRAVTSVLQQTLQDLELLVVDDASRDASLAIAQELASADSRIRAIALPANGGKSRAMNVAIREARGAWIAVLDADDWYDADRLSTLIDCAESHRVPLAADNQFIHDADAGVIVGTGLEVAQGIQLLNQRSFIEGSNPYAQFNLGMLKPVVNAGFIRDTGLAYRENARLSEDFLYLVEFLAAGGTGVIAMRPMYHWTQPFGSVSRRWTNTGAGAWRYDFLSACAANADVLNDLSERGDHDLMRLLEHRAHAFVRLHRISHIDRMRGSGASLSSIVLAILRHPSIWPALGRRLLGAT